MIERKYIILRHDGMHARPAAALVEATRNFECNLNLEYKRKNVNIKSIMGILYLGIPCGATVNISAIGSDEEQAIKSIEEVLKNEGIAN